MTRLPALAAEMLAQVPSEFLDDGCSSAPDSLNGHDLRWACRLHDWWWCTRAHPKGLLDGEWKDAGDHILGLLVRSALPAGLQWVGALYLRAVQRYGSSYDTCGHNGELCRHALPRPAWMFLKQAKAVEAALTVTDVDWENKTVTMSSETPLQRAAREYNEAIADGRLVSVDDDTPFSSELEGKWHEGIVIDEHSDEAVDAMNFAGRTVSSKDWVEGNLGAPGFWDGAYSDTAPDNEEYPDDG